MVAVFSFLCVNVFGQVTCDATGQVLCLGPEYRAQLSVVTLHHPPTPPPTPAVMCDTISVLFVETPHTKKDSPSEEVFFQKAVSVHGAQTT